MKPLSLTYYGDDFTGSVDAMEGLTLSGTRTALFLKPPDPATVAESFDDLHAVGVAGVSRSLPVEEMEAELRPNFEALRRLGAPLCHYKTCSTFDSSPEIGNIGRAIEIGLDVFGSEIAPLVVGAPALRRYVVFGNLFAWYEGERYRIDRHPAMSRHPITPMDEADLRRHLAKQTDLPARLVDIVQLRTSEAERLQAYEAALEQGRGVALLDTLAEQDMPAIGKLLWEGRDRLPFVSGSSGVEYSLSAHWLERGERVAPAKPFKAGSSPQIAVMSGSASPVTALQIERAEQAGYLSLRIDGPTLMDKERSDGWIEDAANRAVTALGADRSVILYAAKGPDDPAIEATKAAAKNHGVPGAAKRLGQEQGRLMRLILQRSGARRACVAGGDTSGYVARELGLFALEYLAPIAPGSPLCRARSDDPAFDGLEIALKAGQVGEPEYFEQVRQGQP